MPFLIESLENTHNSATSLVRLTITSRLEQYIFNSVAEITVAFQQTFPHSAASVKMGSQSAFAAARP
jgi:hypothetical protein